MTDTLQQVLDTPGCERLRDFAAVGPAQRAALELFVDRILAAEGEPMAWRELCRRLYVELFHCNQQMTGSRRKWTTGKTVADVLRDAKDALESPPPKAAPEATQYIALCDAMGYNERTDSLTSPEEHAQSLVAEIKRLKQRAVPMTEEEILVRFDDIVGVRAPDSKIIAFARVIEARKARP